MSSRLPVIPEPRSRIDIHIYYLYIPRIYEPNRKLQAFFKVQKSSEGECPPAQFKSDSIPASATVNPVECSVPVRSSCCSGPADRPLHWDLQRNLYSSLRSHQLVPICRRHRGCKKWYWRKMMLCGGSSGGWWRKDSALHCCWRWTRAEILQSWQVKV